GDADAEERRGRQTQILDDLDVLARGQLSNHDRRADEQHGKQHEVVEHAIAHRLAERVDRNDADEPCHCATSCERSPAASRRLPSTKRTKTSSSVSRTGVNASTRAPAAEIAGSSGSGVEGDSRCTCTRSSPSAVTVAPEAARLARRSADTPSSSRSQPRVLYSTSSCMPPSACRRPAARIATRLQSVSASERMWLLKKIVRPSSRSCR